MDNMIVTLSDIELRALIDQCREYSENELAVTEDGHAFNISDIEKALVDQTEEIDLAGVRSSIGHAEDILLQYQDDNLPLEVAFLMNEAYILLSRLYHNTSKYCKGGE